MNGLIAGMAEAVAQAHRVPSHHGLRLFPTQVSDGSSGIGNTFVDKHAGEVSSDTLNLAAFNGQHGSFGFLLGSAAHQHCQQWQQYT